MTTTSNPNRIMGNKSELIIMDEMTDLTDLQLVIQIKRAWIDELVGSQDFTTYIKTPQPDCEILLTLETAEFSEPVRIQVMRKEIREKDPRNANPIAGNRQVFVVAVNGKISKPLQNRVVAEARAQRMFEEIVERLRKEMPQGWGLF